MAYETIEVKVQNGIAVVTLNRPERLNAISPQLSQELGDAMDVLGADDEVRCFVLTGAGRGFCAGADMGGGGGGPREERGADAIRRGFKGAHKLILGLQRMEKPTIAMVNGVAVGAGADLACACDIRFGSENTRFRNAFLLQGLFPGYGGAWLYPRVMGLAKAAEYLFTTDFIEAQEAYRIGLLNKLVPAAELEKETLALARKIADGPPIAIRLAKLQLYKGLEMDLEAALQVAAACETITISSEDRKEGGAAFREKRAPVFRGV